MQSALSYSLVGKYQRKKYEGRIVVVNFLIKGSGLILLKTSPWYMYMYASRCLRKMTHRLIYELHGLRILSWCPYKDDQHIQAMSTSTCNYLRFSNSITTNMRVIYYKYNVIQLAL